MSVFSSKPRVMDLASKTVNPFVADDSPLTTLLAEAGIVQGAR